MKIGLLSDVHFCRENVLEGDRRCSLSLGKMRAALADFQRQQVELLICMGDLCDVNAAGNTEDSQRCLEELMGEIRRSGLDFLFVTGNHDCLVADREQLARLIGQELAPKAVKKGGMTFLCLDGNYRSDGSPYDPSGFDWRDTNVPPEQLAFLEKSLAEADTECVVLVHEPIDPVTGAWYRINNASEVRKIIEQSGKVKLVLQGHMHEYADLTENGVRYVTVVGLCEGTANRYMLMEKTENTCCITLIRK